MKIILSVALIAMSGILASAQSDEYKRTEFFVGYSYGANHVDYGVGQAAGSFYENRVGHNGFEGSAVVNVSRYFGIKGDLSGAYKSGRFAFTIPSGIQSMPTTTIAFDADNSLYNVLGGVQIKDNSKSGRVKPFGHALVGVARRNNKIAGGGMICIAIIPCPGSTKETAFAAALGGGLDIKLSGRLSFRTFQIDYNPVKFDSGLANNLRLGVGLVF